MKAVAAVDAPVPPPLIGMATVKTGARVKVATPDIKVVVEKV